MRDQREIHRRILINAREGGGLFSTSLVTISGSGTVFWAPILAPPAGNRPLVCADTRPSFLQTQFGVIFLQTAQALYLVRGACRFPEWMGWVRRYSPVSCAKFILHFI